MAGSDFAKDTLQAERAIETIANGRLKTRTLEIVCFMILFYTMMPYAFETHACSGCRSRSCLASSLARHRGHCNLLLPESTTKQAHYHAIIEHRDGEA